MIYVVDSADKQRIEESGMELNKLLRSKGLETCSLLVYANKQDLMSAIDEGEVSKFMGLDQINDGHGRVVVRSVRNQLSFWMLGHSIVL